MLMPSPNGSHRNREDGYRGSHLDGAPSLVGPTRGDIMKRIQNCLKGLHKTGTPRLPMLQEDEAEDLEYPAVLKATVQIALKYDKDEKLVNISRLTTVQDLKRKIEVVTRHSDRSTEAGTEIRWTAEGSGQAPAIRRREVTA